MNKQYSQESFFDTDGDVVIRQFTEIERPSGLIVPQHISTVLVISQIATGDLVGQMDCAFHYDPIYARQQQAGVEIERKTLRFSVGPEDSRGFCKRSATAIVDAFHALTFRGVLPRVQFETVQEASDVADDDRHTLQAVAQLVNDIINGVDQNDLPPSGQYL